MSSISSIRLSIAAALLAASASAPAKFPPMSDDAKAKAAEAAAKATWSDKVAGYQLCKSQDRVATRYAADAKKAGKEVKAAAMPPCADPGPFAYAPPAGASAPAAAAPAAPAASAASPAKKS